MSVKTGDLNQATHSLTVDTPIPAGNGWAGHYLLLDAYADGERR